MLYFCGKKRQLRAFLAYLAWRWKRNACVAELPNIVAR